MSARVLHVASWLSYRRSIGYLAPTAAALSAALMLPTAAQPVISPEPSTSPIYFFVDVPQADPARSEANGSKITAEDLSYLASLQDQIIQNMENLGVPGLRKGEGDLPKDRSNLVVSIQLLFHLEKGILIPIIMNDGKGDPETDWSDAIALASDGDLGDHIREIKVGLQTLVRPAIVALRARAAGAKILLAHCIRPSYGDRTRTEPISRYLTLKYAEQLQESLLKTTYWIKGIDNPSFDRLCGGEEESEHPLRRASHAIISGILDDFGSEQEVTVYWTSGEQEGQWKRVLLTTANEREALKRVVDAVVELGGRE